jgi:hypothetical protein
LVPATNAVIVLAGPPHPALACETVASTVHVASEVAASAVHVAHEAAWAIYAAHEVTAEARGGPRTGPVGPWPWLSPRNFRSNSLDFGPTKKPTKDRADHGSE